MVASRRDGGTTERNGTHTALRKPKRRPFSLAADSDFRVRMRKTTRCWADGNVRATLIGRLPSRGICGRRRRRPRRSTHLGLFDCCVLPITHGADVETLFALAVALLVQLFHDERNPTTVDVERLRRVAQVGAVHHVLKHLRPTNHNGVRSCAQSKSRPANAISSKNNNNTSL